MIILGEIRMRLYGTSDDLSHCDLSSSTCTWGIHLSVWYFRDCVLYHCLFPW